AKETLPNISFDIADLETFTPKEPVDLFFSNAVLMLLPKQSLVETLTRLIENLSPGGVLAFQVPNTLSQPSHMALSQSFMQATRGAKTRPHVPQGRDEFLKAYELQNVLSPLCSDVDIWETRYFHKMESHQAIVEWIKGTALRPFLDPLSKSQRDGFLKDYLWRLRKFYPKQKDGTVLLPYLRLFVVATKA
ncbi:trans-aconitate 2-methyltransferase, partial [Candidatus Bathyarchaeota archaeon]|nr:trans-aconitate 2-methyltransferase [Candidatus Bathyarchaeota archaeon]